MSNAHLHHLIARQQTHDMHRAANRQRLAHSLHPGRRTPAETLPSDASAQPFTSSGPPRRPSRREPVDPVHGYFAVLQAASSWLAPWETSGGTHD